jgi:hypothetical protein
MARQISNANALAPAAARANSRANYPNQLATNPAASQDKARPNLLNRDAEMGRSTGGCDCNKTGMC